MCVTWHCMTSQTRPARMPPAGFGGKQRSWRSPEWYKCVNYLRVYTLISCGCFTVSMIKINKTNLDHELLFSFEAITQQKLFGGRALPASTGVAYSAPPVPLAGFHGSRFVAGQGRGTKGREENGRGVRTKERREEMEGKKRGTGEKKGKGGNQKLFRGSLRIWQRAVSE